MTLRPRSGPTSRSWWRTGSSPHARSSPLALVGDNGRRPAGEAPARRRLTIAGSGTRWTHYDETLSEIHHARRHEAPERSRPSASRRGARARHDERLHLHRLRERPQPIAAARPREEQAQRPPHRRALGLVGPRTGRCRSPRHAYAGRSSRCHPVRQRRFDPSPAASAASATPPSSPWSTTPARTRQTTSCDRRDRDAFRRLATAAPSSRPPRGLPRRLSPGRRRGPLPGLAPSRREPQVLGRSSVASSSPTPPELHQSQSRGFDQTIAKAAAAASRSRNGDSPGARAAAAPASTPRSPRRASPRWVRPGCFDNPLAGSGPRSFSLSYRP